ncbi:hypothetical protein ACROYT_G023457 [Oculina patagonica]
MGQSNTAENLPKAELINADFITIVITVAKMYRDIDHLEEACKLLEKLEATFLLVHGRKHSLYGSLLYQIGSFKLGAGNAAEAFKTLQQAEAIFVHNFGKGHHMVAWCKSLLGTCALVKGQAREASTHLTEALVLFKKMNHHHPEVAEILLKLALLSSEEGNFQSAKKTVQEAVDIFISACGEVSPKTGSAYFQAAAILQKARESRAAVDEVRKAIDIFLQLGLRCDHPDVKTCRSLLGVLLASLGEVEEAEEQFSEVQQQVPLQDEPCLTAKIIAPENTNMFFQAKTDFGTGQALALTKVEGDEVCNASAVDDGEFFLFLEPDNSSLSVVVEKESVVVKCRSVKEFESTCICSLVKNTLDRTMESLCRVVRVKFEASVQLPCGDYLKESANCGCGCRDVQRESTRSKPFIGTFRFTCTCHLKNHEAYHLEGKPSADVLLNENAEDILFSGHPVEKISTEVCVNLLECLLSNRHVSPEAQQSGTDEMLSTITPPLDDSTHLTQSTLLSPGSTSSLNSLPTSPSNAVNKMPVFSQNMSPIFPERVAAERCDEKDDSNADHLQEKSSMAWVGGSESPLHLAREGAKRTCWRQLAPRLSHHEIKL